MRGIGRALSATLLMMAGFINIIYGIGALDDANIFVNDQRFVFTNLSTMGWVLIILGIVQITGGLSLFVGNTYGRIIGVIGASLGAIAGAAVDRRQRSLVVAGRLRPVRVRPPRDPAVRRRRRADDLEMPSIRVAHGEIPVAGRATTGDAARRRRRRTRLRRALRDLDPAGAQPPAGASTAMEIRDFYLGDTPATSRSSASTSPRSPGSRSCGSSR